MKLQSVAFWPHSLKPLLHYQVIYAPHQHTIIETNYESHRKVFEYIVSLPRFSFLLIY